MDGARIHLYTTTRPRTVEYLSDKTKTFQTAVAQALAIFKLRAHEDTSDKEELQLKRFLFFPRYYANLRNAQ